MTRTMIHIQVDYNNLSFRYSFCLSTLHLIREYLSLFSHCRLNHVVEEIQVKSKVNQITL